MSESVMPKETRREDVPDDIDLISMLRKQLAEAQEHYSKCNWSLQETMKQRDDALAELAHYRAAETGMPGNPVRLHKNDGVWVRAEEYDKLRARRVALEAKMQGKVMIDDPEERAFKDGIEKAKNRPDYDLNAAAKRGEAEHE